MIIKSVCLINFGKFNNKVVEFSDGVNILYGENEAGKTTLHTFIKAMLFGIDSKHGKSAEDNEYERYLPWDNPDEYKGSMIIEADGKEYLIERNFLRSEKQCIITETSTGRKLNKDEIEKLFYGFDENCYYNTISISQLGSITNKELGKVLKSYAANLGSTKTTEINIEEALNNLEDTKERLILEGGADKKDEVDEEILRVNAEINELELEEKSIVDGIEDIMEKISRLKAKIKALEELDTVQTERQIKKNIDQENMLQRTEMLTADMDRLEKDKERSEQHQRELKATLDEYGVTNKQEIEKEIEWLLGRPNISIICILFIVASLVLCGVFYALNPNVVFSEVTSWIKEVVCLGVAVIFAVVFVVVYFVRKSNKAKKIALLKELKITLDRYHAAINESIYADKQLKAKKKELNNVSFRLQAEKENPHEMSDYNAEIVDIKREISELREEKSKSQWLLEQKKEGMLKLNKQMEVLNEKIERIKSVDFDLQAVDEAKEMILEISNEVKKSFGDALNKRASEYMSHITNDKYNDLTINEDVKITVKNRIGIDVPVEKLSKGTIEQIYMSLRLAAADIIFEEDKKPILLDDAFVMYDNKRMANTMKFMAEGLEQVIIFSCHTREKIMADKLALDYHLVVVS